MAEYIPTVVAESDHAWTVKCQAPGCPNLVNVPKRTFDATGFTIREEPAPRGCLDHPPATWAEVRDDATS
jgi:hypothetical protein